MDLHDQARAVVFWGVVLPVTAATARRLEQTRALVLSSSALPPPETVLYFAVGSCAGRRAIVAAPCSQVQFLHPGQVLELRPGFTPPGTSVIGALLSALQGLGIDPEETPPRWQLAVVVPCDCHSPLRPGAKELFADLIRRMPDPPPIAS
jgi:hypothetical protein